MLSVLEEFTKYNADHQQHCSVFRAFFWRLYTVPYTPKCIGNSEEKRLVEIMNYGFGKRCSNPLKRAFTDNICLCLLDLFGPCVALLDLCFLFCFKWDNKMLWYVRPRAAIVSKIWVAAFNHSYARTYGRLCIIVQSDINSFEAVVWLFR